MRRLVWSIFGFALVCRPVAAQGLRDKISELFVFAPGQQPLFLGGTGVHENHFITSASTQNGILISFIGNAIGTNVDSPACDSIEGRDCAPYGIPRLENDVIAYDWRSTSI